MPSIQQARFLQIFQTLSGSEINGLEKLLHSPYFNQREDLKRLLVFLKANAFSPPSADELWKAVNPNKPFTRTDFNRLVSRFTQLIESFLMLERPIHPCIAPLELTSIFRERRLDILAQSNLHKAQKLLDSSSRRDSQWHLHQYLIAENSYSHSMDSNQRYGMAPPLLKASSALDEWFILEKLKLACSLLARQQLSSEEIQLDFLEEVLQRISTGDLPPAISIYSRALAMLRPPQKEGNFVAFQKNLQAHAHLFPTEEQRSLFLMAINFCIRQINQGENQYLPIMYGMYQQGLSEQWLFDREELSAWTFKNIVSSGLKMKDFEGVEAFLNTYKNRLPEAIQTPFFRYNYAELQLARGEYREALRTLRFFHFKDALTDLRARLVQIKAGFELGDVQLVDYQISNLRQLIQRRKELAYHRENYRNFARLVKRLINLKPGDVPAKQRLRKAIAESNALVEQSWLLAQLEDVE